MTRSILEPRHQFEEGLSMCLILPLTCRILPLKLRCKMIKIMCKTANYALTKVEGTARSTKNIVRKPPETIPTLSPCIPLAWDIKVGHGPFPADAVQTQDRYDPINAQTTAENFAGAIWGASRMSQWCRRPAVPYKIIHRMSYFGILMKDATVYNFTRYCEDWPLSLRYVTPQNFRRVFIF